MRLRTMGAAVSAVAAAVSSAVLYAAGPAAAATTTQDVSSGPVAPSRTLPMKWASMIGKTSPRTTGYSARVGSLVT
ncbi:hypothetical protein QFZ76_000584 [Streptomyces sp. V4I2]|nr:hypothetical protein [Streptomyces sp. V4I2]